MKDITIPENMEREVKSIVLVSLGAFLFFFYVFSAGVKDVYTALVDNDPNLVAEAEVFGTSTTSENGGLVTVKLNNSKLGEAVLEYVFEDKTNFAGSELYFEITGDLEVMDVICEPGFMCIEGDEGDLSVTILRLPEYADIPLTGQVPVATIVYDHVTSGELIMNGVSTNRSTLTLVGSDVNILSPEIEYLFAGDYDVE